MFFPFLKGDGPQLRHPDSLCPAGLSCIDGDGSDGHIWDMDLAEGNRMVLLQYLKDLLTGGKPRVRCRP